LFFWFFFFFLRAGLSVWFWLALNLWFACFCLPSAGITGVNHHTQLAWLLFKNKTKQNKTKLGTNLYSQYSGESAKRITWGQEFETSLGNMARVKEGKKEGREGERKQGREEIN
jgi:hypothetical protein